MEKCPCQSGLIYSDCCEPLITGQRQAETAEELMRSRYTAHVKKDVPYILKTVHPSRRHEHKQETIQQWLKTTEWQGLKILGTMKGQAGDEEGRVEFVADFLTQGIPGKHREVSDFKKHSDNWFFLKGDVKTEPKEKQMPVRNELKISRNDPCPCGSGKKYKKCCAA